MSQTHQGLTRRRRKSREPGTRGLRNPGTPEAGFKGLCAVDKYAEPKLLKGGEREGLR